MATIVLGTSGYSKAAVLVYGNIIERFESSASCWDNKAREEFTEWRKAMAKKHGITTIEVVNL